MIQTKDKETEVESFKNVTVCTPIGLYKRLQVVSKVNGLSISKLAKEGIVLVLKQYEEKKKLQ